MTFMMFTALLGLLLFNAGSYSFAQTSSCGQQVSSIDKLCEDDIIKRLLGLPTSQDVKESQLSCHLPPGHPMLVRLLKKQQEFRVGTCERIYYDLFNSKTLRVPQDERLGLPCRAQPLPQMDVQVQQARKSLAAAEDAIRRIFAENSATTPERNIAKEWLKRLGNLKIEAAQTNPAAPALGAPRTESKAAEIGKTIDGSAILASGEIPGLLLLGPVIGAYSNAEDAFWLGHEAAHAIEWAPKKRRACLESSNSVGARYKYQPILDEHQFEKAKAVIDRLMTEVNDYPPKGSPRQKRSGSNGASFGGGAGTEDVGRWARRTSTDPAGTREDFEARIRRGQEFEAMVSRLQDMVKQKKLDPVLGLSELAAFLPSQISEANADAWGTEILVDRIEKQSSDPTKQKGALLSALMTLPPQLFQEPDGRYVMDRVGPKPTNETRVLRTIMAHPKIRKMLQCEFQSAPPVYCEP